MPVPMPAAVVLIVCKTVLVGEPDQNAGYTGHENREWDYTDSVMHCRRIEMPLMDSAEMQGADPQPFNTQRCNRAIWMQGVQWNERNKRSNYRFYKGACPTPIVDTRTGEVIAWQLPDCGERGLIVCEKDTAI